MWVCLHENTGWLARLIRWQTRSRFSHASIMFGDQTVYEAIEGVGVRKVERAEPGTNVSRFRIPLTYVDDGKVRGFLEKQLGKPYDYRMVIRFVTRRQEARKSRGKWFCSELVYAAIRKGGLSLFSRTEPWEVSPGLLARSRCLVFDPVKL